MTTPATRACALLAATVAASRPGEPLPTRLTPPEPVFEAHFDGTLAARGPEGTTIVPTDATAATFAPGRDRQALVLYLQGAYGVGKQSTAKALCCELGMSLLAVDGDRLMKAKE